MHEIVIEDRNFNTDLQRSNRRHWKHDGTEIYSRAGRPTSDTQGTLDGSQADRGKCGEVLGTTFSVMCLAGIGRPQRKQAPAPAPAHVPVLHRSGTGTLFVQEGGLCKQPQRRRWPCGSWHLTEAPGTSGLVASNPHSLFRTSPASLFAILVSPYASLPAGCEVIDARFQY